MSIYDVSSPADYELICMESETVGLISYVKNKKIDSKGIQKLVQSLSEYSKLAQKMNADHAYYIATASLRNIDNSAEIIALVKETLGIDIELISGETEALLSFKGLKISMKQSGSLRSGIMVDMGGGSTEIIGFVDGMPVHAVSLPFGCLSLFNKYISVIFPTADEISQIKKYVDSCLAELGWLDKYGDTVYFIGGTGRAIYKLHTAVFDLTASSLPYSFDHKDLKKLTKQFETPGKDEINLLSKIVPDRIHTVIPGFFAYTRIMKYAKSEHITITSAGLREGYLSEKIGSAK
jgi:exopolyphosphatase/guanosine-5'-triphosphate,3'-diphosphate pyrophosphatase